MSLQNGIDSEVARRWLILCPERRNKDGKSEMPSEFELNYIRKDKAKLKVIRNRLSDISWWMRLLSQHIAQPANKEDGEVGKFFQARYRGHGQHWHGQRCCSVRAYSTEQSAPGSGATWRRIKFDRSVCEQARGSLQ